MSKTLLVWEQIPEETNFFLIPNEVLANNNWQDLMKQANNTFINVSDENDGLRFLNAALLDEKYIDDDSMFDDGYTMIKHERVKTHEATPKEWRCVLAKYKLDKNVVIENENISRVILSGFAL